MKTRREKKNEEKPGERWGGRGEDLVRTRGQGNKIRQRFSGSKKKEKR